MRYLAIAVLMGCALPAVAAQNLSVTGAPVVHSSTAATSAAAPMPPQLAVSTYTVSTLYTGDRARDPFQASAVGGVARVRDRNAPFVADIHSMQLRGVLQDSSSSFAVFRADDGTVLVLRGGHLYDDRNKIIPGITGRVQIRQKRAELITSDKDVQVYTLGETDDEAKEKAQRP